MTTQKFPTFTNQKTTGKKIEQKKKISPFMFPCIPTDFQSVLAHVSNRHPGRVANREINSWIFPGRIEVGGSERVVHFHSLR